MSLIQNITSTLRTWVFKKKLLKFSGRFKQEPEACFYCPEMCRFSCPTAETLRDNTVTPRGKMSLLHLAEKGFSVEQVAGTAEKREWVLEQCTGCGRCTEYCLYENDVASVLRLERTKFFEPSAAAGAASVQSTVAADFSKLLARLSSLQGKVLLCEKGRLEWWRARPKLLEKLEVSQVEEIELPHRDWEWGKLSAEQVKKIGAALKKCKWICAESPELAWFFAKGLKDETSSFKGEVRTVWQKFFPDFLSLELSVDAVFHESFYLSRHLPRLGYSIPMYERGLMPFHSGWNMWDCGGEGYYQLAHPQNAKDIGARFIADLKKDGRAVKKIVCQNRACMDHLSNIATTYWLDEVFE